MKIYLEERRNKKIDFYEKACNITDSDNTWYFVTMVISLLIGIVGVLVCSGEMIGGRNQRLVQKEIDKLEMERTALVYRLDTQQEIGNEYLYNDIIEFNKKIHDYKVDRDNPWINWFVDPAFTEIEEINYIK